MQSSAESWRAAVVPMSARLVPAAQLVQGEPAAPAYLPASQTLQSAADTDPRAEDVPAEHSPVQSFTESWRAESVPASARYLRE